MARLQVWGGHADLLLLVVLTWTALRGQEEGVIWAFAGGLMLDLLSGGPLGAAALALLIVTFLSGLVWGAERSALYLRMAITVAVGTLLYHALLLLLLGWAGHTVDWTQALFAVVPASVAANLLLSPLVIAPLNYIQRRIRREALTF